MTRPLETVRTELDAMTRTAARYTNGSNEGGDGFSPYSAALRALQSEYDTIAEATADERVAAIQAATLQAWTKELTIERRAAWNTWVRSQDNTTHPATVARKIEAQGWSIRDLKAAIKRHGL